MAAIGEPSKICAPCENEGVGHGNEDRTDELPQKAKAQEPTEDATMLSGIGIVVLAPISSGLSTLSMTTMKMP